VPETDTEEDVEAYLDGLTQTIPVPKVFETVAAYYKNDKLNDLVFCYAGLCRLLFRRLRSTIPCG